MALPVIIVDSASGSDSLASGAGPGDGTTAGSALTGTAASTSGTGLVVTLDGSPDLSGVLTTGAHVIYLADATAGARNFSKITAVDNVAKTVTVADAFGLNLTGKSWAIGGKRATVAGTNSLKLFSNNAAAGDAMPGWAAEMQSGHSETITSPIDLRRAGDTTSGQIILRGKSGAATAPVIHITGAVNGVVCRGTYQVVRDLVFSAENAAVVSAVNCTANDVLISGIKLTRTSTNAFTTGIVLATGGYQVRDCEIAFCTTGVSVAGGSLEAVNNWFHDVSGSAFDGFTDTLGIWIHGNAIYGCGAHAINVGAWGGGTGNRHLIISHNTIDSSAAGKDAIKVTVAPADGLVTILNNILSNNGGYGIEFSSASATDAALTPRIHVQGNQTYNNTSGAYKSATAGYAYNTCPWASGDNNLNPTYTNASGGDFSIGTNLKAAAYPVGGTLHVGTTSSTYSYVDPGSAQRQEPNNPVAKQTIIQNIGTY